MTGEIKHYRLSDLAIGTTDTLLWRVEPGELDAFAALSGDINPLHLDDDFARSKGFHGRIAHGFLLGAKISALVGTRLPGRDCTILDTKLDFPAPVRPGDLVDITGTVDFVSAEQAAVRIRVVARVKDGNRVVGRGSVACLVR